MRILSFLDGVKPALGARIGEQVVDLTAAGLPDTLEALLELGDHGLARARRIADVAGATRNLASLRCLAPLRSPAHKAIAVGLNYADHAAEAKFETPPHPVLFHRYASSWVGPGEPLERPGVSTQFDFEGELLVVIGRPGRAIRQEDALDHVAGYSIFNDGSIRDYQFKSSQWMLGKNFDRSGSMGPEFVTADELPRGATGLQLRTRLNGRLVQDANTRDMIFDVATLIRVASEAMTLRPGDLIISGTPAGVGMARKPPLYMKAGDVCDVEIEGIGVLSNPVQDGD